MAERRDGMALPSLEARVRACEREGCMSAETVEMVRKYRTLCAFQAGDFTTALPGLPESDHVRGIDSASPRLTFSFPTSSEPTPPINFLSATFLSISVLPYSYPNFEVQSPGK